MAMAAQDAVAAASMRKINAMKWGSLLWLCYAAAEIGRQPKPPLTEEQKRRRQQYVADKKIKRARQLKRMRWEVQQRRQAEREATAPLTSGEIARDAARRAARHYGACLNYQKRTTSRSARASRASRCGLRRVTKTQKSRSARFPKQVACTEFIRLMYRLEGDPHWWKDPHFHTDASTLLKKGDEREAEAYLMTRTGPRWHF